MNELTNLRAFLYRLATAALRVGVVLGVALPLIVLAARPWKTSEQVANESSGKRPSALAFDAIEVSGVAPILIVDSTATPCAEVALLNNSTVDVCLSWITTSQTCAANAVNCDLANGSNVWLLKAGSAYVTRYPWSDLATLPGSYYDLCADPYAASAALVTDKLFVSCLVP